MDVPRYITVALIILVLWWGGIVSVSAATNPTVTVNYGGGYCGQTGQYEATTNHIPIIPSQDCSSAGRVINRIATTTRTVIIYFTFIGFHANGPFVNGKPVYQLFRVCVRRTVGVRANFTLNNTHGRIVPVCPRGAVFTTNPYV